VCATRAKFTPNWRSFSRMRYFGPSPNAVASCSGTRDPYLAGRPPHADMDHFARVQVDDWQEIAGPHIPGMSVKEGRPALSLWSRRAYPSQVLLDRPLPDVKTELEHFAPDPLRSQDADSALPCPESTLRSLRLPLVWKELLWTCISN
jgi:hypothetical protein